MLKNAPTLTIVAVDTAENEPLEKFGENERIDIKELERTLPTVHTASAPFVDAS